MKQGQSIRDASHLYEAERRVEHAARPRLSYFGVAALADAEGAVAQPQQSLMLFTFWKDT